MLQRIPASLIVTIHLLAFVPACDRKERAPESAQAAGTSKSATEQPGAAQLRTHLQQAIDALHAGDSRPISRLANDLAPNESRLRAALRDGVPRMIVSRLQGFIAGQRSHDLARQLALIVAPKQIQIVIEEESTETFSASEWPAGSCLANYVLRPGTPFYNVNLTVPGSDAENWLFLIYWDGSQWSMLGQVWETICDDAHLRASLAYMAQLEKLGQKPPKTSAEYLRLLSSAESGDTDAQTTMGLANAFEDWNAARHWYRKAADRGHIVAQYALGQIYDEGHGIQANDAEAVYWYRKSAEGGFPDAQNALGVMYVDGTGVKRDLEQAVVWFKRAADQGDPDARHNLEQLQKRGVPSR